MKRLDFDFSKHIEVPDEWIEKALAIPAAEPVKPPLIALNRRLIAAAIILPVLGLNLLLFFSIGNKNSIPVRPSPTAASAGTPTESAEASPPSDSASISPTASPTQPETQAVTQTAMELATDSEGEIIVITRIITTYVEEVEATAGAASNPSSTPSSHTPKPNETTDNPKPYPTAAPTSHPATETGRPTVTPTQKATENPTEAPAPKPTEAATVVRPVTITCRLPSYESQETDPVAACADPESVYCRLYKSGKLIGDADLYNDAHRAELIRSDTGATLYYRGSIPAPAGGYTAASSVYTYTFYDADGHILATGTVQV